MTFWAQHGYGKGSKLADLASTGRLAGVLLSPGDEPVDNLRATYDALMAAGVSALIDPQLYVHTIQGAVARCHEDHGIDFGEVSWFVSPAEIDSQVRAILATNVGIGTDAVIAPAPYQASFGDVWTPISLQYGRATLDTTDKPVYLSLVAEDVAFADWSQTQAYLDALTTLDAHGVYLVVGTSGQTYPVSWDPQRLANVLRVIHTLAELNQYEVIWGYSDIAGLAGVAAGATSFASGWYHSLRMWSPQKWVPKTGGRSANPRFLAAPLMSPIEAAGEGGSIMGSALASRAVPDPSDRKVLRTEGAFGIADAWLQHLMELSSLATVAATPATPTHRVDQLSQNLISALTLLDDLDHAGVAIGAAHRTRLLAIQQGLDIFRRAASL